MNSKVVWNGLKVSFLIIGTTIGAGYASGREIWEFFTYYGKNSNYAIVLAMLLFTICCFIIMNISNYLKSPNYLQVLEELVGKPLSRVYDILILFYLMSVTVVMFAGSGATLEYWSYSYWLGVFLIGILVFIIFLKDVEGLMSINSILIPILIITLISVCIVFLKDVNITQGIRQDSENAFPSAITFTALNILPIIAVLSAIGAKMNKAEIKIASISSGIGLTIITLLFNTSLLQIGFDVSVYEVPLFAILKDFSPHLIVGVSIVLWLAIYTTAISGIFGLVTRLKTSIPLPIWMIAGILILLFMPLTQFGFANLVKLLYPLYGVLNLFILAMILIYPLAKEKKSKLALNKIINSCS